MYQVNRFPIYVCFAFVLCLPIYKATAESCTDSLDSYRTENETYFLRSEESPFSEEFKANFAGFSYFQGDEQYCVDATFELINNGKTIDYPTFDGKTIPFRKIGVFLQFRGSYTGSDGLSAHGLAGKSATVGARYVPRSYK